MGSHRRFVKKIPPSGAAPSFKLTLPHQVVHQYLLHLVDNDLELADSPNAEQTWHASIAPRRNKERSEFTLQGWRLFAEAHKVQAGDQVAFELVSENRLVAQVIKHADANQAPRPVSQKRKFVPGPRAPNSVFQRPGPNHFKTLDDVPFPGDEEWDTLPDAFTSGGASTYSHLDGYSHKDAEGRVLPPCPAFKVEPLVVPDWAAGDRLASQRGGHTMGMGLGSSISLESDSGPIHCSLDRNAPARVPQISFSSCMSPQDSPETPMTYTAYPDVFDDTIDDFILGDEFINTESMHIGEVPRVPSQRREPGFLTAVSTPTPLSTHSPRKCQLGEFSTIVHNLQRKAQVAQSEAEEAQHRVVMMRSSVEGLQSNLRAHSRRALKAAMGLENCGANLSYTNSLPTEMTGWLNQLKNSLSQLLIMAIDDDHLAADPSPSRSQDTLVMPR